MSGSETIVQLSDGAKLHVWILGTQDKNKPLLITLHGAPGLSNHTDPKAAYDFLKDKFRVLVYDARGSGVSDLKGPFTDERWVADVDELRTWAGAETFVLAGGSYGGFLALNYAIHFPNRLSGLILRDTWACGPRGVLRALAAILTSPRINPDPNRQVRIWSGNVQGIEDGNEGIAEILPIYTPERQAKTSPASPAVEGGGELCDQHWDTHNAAFSYSQPRFDVRSKLGQITAPTLIVVGRHDPICPVEESEEIHAAIPNSQMVVFENSGHNPPAEEPEAFQETAWSFLSLLPLDW